MFVQFSSHGGCLYNLCSHGGVCGICAATGSVCANCAATGGVCAVSAAMGDVCAHCAAMGGVRTVYAATGGVFAMCAVTGGVGKRLQSNAFITYGMKWVPQEFRMSNKRRDDANCLPSHLFSLLHNIGGDCVVHRGLLYTGDQLPMH